MTDPSGPVTVQQIMDAHAQFGRLDRQLVKKAMGPNWPTEWDRAYPDIFEREKEDT